MKLSFKERNNSIDFLVLFLFLNSSRFHLRCSTIFVVLEACEKIMGKVPFIHSSIHETAKAIFHHVATLPKLCGFLLDIRIKSSISVLWTIKQSDISFGTSLPRTVSKLQGALMYYTGVIDCIKNSEAKYRRRPIINLISPLSLILS